VVVLTFVVIADFKVVNMVPASFNIIYLVAGNYLVVLFAVTIKLINNWYRMDKKNLLLEKQSMEIALKLKEAELKLLKAQIHPHFLFNTLNNLYGLVLSKSNNAPDIVLKISSLLDYMLYQSTRPSVEVSKEIHYIKNYIELEQLRYSNLEIELNENGIYDHCVIAPMILQPFIENAFKHGISKDIDNQWLRINIDLDQYILKFFVKNPKRNDRIVDKTGYSEGIGLKNVQKRLNIIYPDRHNLEIEEDEDTFSIALSLELNSEI
jgi:LytS/YehU family sensor histidine kinase